MLEFHGCSPFFKTPHRPRERRGGRQGADPKGQPIKAASTQRAGTKEEDPGDKPGLRAAAAGPEGSDAHPAGGAGKRRRCAPGAATDRDRRTYAEFCGHGLYGLGTSPTQKRPLRRNSFLSELWRRLRRLNSIPTSWEVSWQPKCLHGFCD